MAARTTDRQGAAFSQTAPRLLSVLDVERETGLSRWTVRDLVASGALPAVKLPGVRRVLVDRRDLERAIETWKR